LRSPGVKKRKREWVVQKTERIAMRGQNEYDERDTKEDEMRNSNIGAEVNLISE
jgi:hypothetical protein